MSLHFQWDNLYLFFESYQHLQQFVLSQLYIAFYSILQPEILPELQPYHIGIVAFQILLRN